MNELLVLGASHKTAPLAVRERLALLDGQVEPFLRSLRRAEAVVLSTCNRTELYVVADDDGAAVAALWRGGEPGALRRAQLRRGAAPVPGRRAGWSR